METLLAGAGIAEIKLDGLLTQTRENFTRILNPLHVRVVLIRGERAAALVSLELTSLMDGVDILRSRVGTLTDTDPEYVWITVSHTFSAPHLHVGQSAGPGGPGDREAARSPEELALRKKQTEALLDAVDAAAKQAYASLRPARIGYGTGTAQVNTGRDVETAEGWWLTEGSTAYADHNLGVIRLDDLDARPIAVIYNFAVQSSVLDQAPMSDGGLVVSGDLAGAASEAAERRYPGAVALFLCGAAGDQAPRGSAQYMADELAFERITYAAQSGPFAAGAAEILREHAVALAGHMAEPTN